MCFYFFTISVLIPLTLTTSLDPFLIFNSLYKYWILYCGLHLHKKVNLTVNQKDFCNNRLEKQTTKAHRMYNIKYISDLILI